MRIILVLFVLAFSAASCQESGERSGQSISREDLIDANRKKVGVESKMIDDFVNRSGWEMEKTKTGIRYEIYHSQDGKTASEGEEIYLSYNLYLLDGALIDSASARQPLRFRVGQGDVVSGLHEAATLLSVGDSARFIIPSYLAYGLTGDQKRIPPNAALFYDVHVEKLD